MRHICETLSGVGPVFVIRGGPNSEHLLTNLRKLLKRGTFFLTTQETESTQTNLRKLVSYKKNVYLLDAFLDGFFLKTKPGADPKISRREGES